MNLVFLIFQCVLHGLADKLTTDSSGPIRSTRPCRFKKSGFLSSSITMSSSARVVCRR